MKRNRILEVTERGVIQGGIKILVLTFFYVLVMCILPQRTLRAKGSAKVVKLPVLTDYLYPF